MNKTTEKIAEKGVHIVRLEGENVLRLKAVRIDAKGKSVRITGKNEAGKTSLLNLIRMGLGGKDGVPDMPIGKHGDTASAEIELDNGLVVKWRATKASTYLDVCAADGAVHKTPQTILNRLLGRDGRAPLVAFDPLEFARMDPHKRLKVIEGLTGVAKPLAEWADTDAKLRKERTLANRDIKNHEAQELDKFPADTPNEPVDVAGLLEQLSVIDKAAAERVDAERRVDRAREELEHLHNLEVKAIKIIEEAQAELSNLREDAIPEAETLIAKREESRDSIMVGDASAVRNQLASAEQQNRNVERKRRAAEYEKRWIALHQAAEEADAAVQASAKARKEIWAGAKMPIEGLTVNETGLAFEDVPLEQRGKSKIVDVSIAVAMALNPKLRVILIDEAESLDDETKARILASADEKSYQVWTTEVASSPKGASVHIVDGEVASAAEGRRTSVTV